MMPMLPEEEGQGLVEYALIIILLIVVVALVYFVVWPAVQPAVASFLNEITGSQGTP